MAVWIGPFGGLRGITTMRQILQTIQTLVATEQVLVPLAHTAFEDGALKDPLPAQILGRLVARFRPRPAVIACHTASTIPLHPPRPPPAPRALVPVPAIKPPPECPKPPFLSFLAP